MPTTVVHGYVNPVPDDPAEQALNKTLPSHWNDDHVVTLEVDLETEVAGQLPLANVADIADQTILGNDNGGLASPQALTAAEVRTMLSIVDGVSSVTAANASLTVSPTTGAVLANVNLAHTFVWTAGHTFNNVSPTFGTMTLGSVFFAGTGGQLTQDNANFFWDNTDNRLCVGTNTPLETVTVAAAGDRCAMVTNYTGTGTTIASGSGWVASFNGTEKAAFGWLAPTNSSSGFNTPEVMVVHSIADPLHIYTDAAEDVKFGTGNGAGVVTERLRILGAAGSGSVAGNVGIATANPTAKLHLPAGSATAGTAPLKFTSGTLLSVAEAGAVEFLTDKWYGTITTGTALKEFALADKPLTADRVAYTTTNGRLTDSSNFTYDSTTLKVTTSSADAIHIISATAAGYSQLVLYSDSGNTGALAITGSAFGTSGLYQSNQVSLTAFRAGGLMLQTNTTSPVVIGSNSTARVTCDAAGNVVVGPAAVATNATDGFLYIPSCAGTPTGAPTAYAGRVAMVFDTTNNKLYVYDGGWIDVT